MKIDYFIDSRFVCIFFDNRISRSVLIDCLNEINLVMLISYLLDFSKSILLYQEQVTYGLLLNLIVMVLPATLVIISYYLWSSGEITSGLALTGHFGR